MTGAAFNALNGLEALEVIMAKIRKGLEATGEFKQHVTIPLMKFQFDVQVWNHPKDDLNGKPSIVAKAEVGEAPKDLAPAIVATNKDIVDTPDKERREAGLEIPKVQPTNTGLVDVRQDKEKPAEGPSKAEGIREAIEAVMAAKKAVVTGAEKVAEGTKSALVDAAGQIDVSQLLGRN